MIEELICNLDDCDQPIPTLTKSGKKIPNYKRKRMKGCCAAHSNILQGINKNTINRNGEPAPTKSKLDLAIDRFIFAERPF